VDHFFKDSFLNLQSFEFLERTSDFQTASMGAWWTSQVCVVTSDGPNPKVWAGSVHSPVKYVVSS